ncbi:MAG: Nif3-like dinuclear metal center hexameric protein [Akkermansiaceae bacterium]|nr:Nif3-like dinuclear metal center hexameric protein [Akkermansiaceae bacterium]MCP5551955.1 Nif3-like dinuclear metal center hexameric protein [Akkermansiaceae bacterium]
MVPLDDIVNELDAELRLAEIPDYPNAHNGLQLAAASGKTVRKVAAAVDACLPVIRAAVDAEADLLLVHHGLFWPGAQRIVGGLFEKLKLAMDAGLAIYSAHIPLDVHPTLGNNARLAAALGFENVEPFFDWKGIRLGLRAAVSLDRASLVQHVGEATGAGAHLCPGGPDTVRSVGIVTGGAGSEIFAAAATGIDTFITGEGPHWSYTAAEELGLNLIYGGHYATETFGVKALAECLETRHGLPWEFLDHPTGL